MKVLIALCAVSLFGHDPFVGVWKLNVAKSSYAPGQSPKSMTIELAAAGNGVSYSSETEYANGRNAKSRYTAVYDGPETIVMGGNGLQTPVALHRIDASTVEATYMRSMKVLATSKRVVSKDERTMIVTTVSRDSAGKQVVNIGVYDRVGR